MARSITSSSDSGSLNEPKQVITLANDQNSITDEPSAMREPSMAEDRQTMATVEDNESGYHGESNECIDFCQDFFMCFGACSACCPSSGEGCLSSLAAFFGNLCFACCKC